MLVALLGFAVLFGPLLLLAKTGYKQGGTYVGECHENSQEYARAVYRQ